MKQLWKRGAALLVALGMLLSLSGCAAGGRELYERLLIHGIGVDADGEEFVVTVRSSVSPEDEGEEYFRCRGRTVLEALGSLSRSTGRQPFYAHNYLVVFGKKCAEQGLDRCLDFFVRYYNTRPAVRLYLAETTAEEVLSFQKDGKYLKMSELQQLGDSSRETGSTVQVELLDFLNSVKRPGSSPVLPVLQVGKDEVKIASTAYFDGCVCKGLLTLEETRGFLAAKGKLEQGEAVVEGGFGTATLSLSGGSGKISLQWTEDGAPLFHIRVEAAADLSALSGSRDRPAEEEYAQLEAALVSLLEEEIEAAVRTAVLENGCDIFGFGSLLSRRAPDYWKTVSETWRETLPGCAYTMSVTARVSRLVQR